MDKIIDWMSRIPKDKLLHSFYGVLVYILMSLVDLELALWTVVILAVAKECYDEYKYGRFDYVDILATIAIPYTLYLKEVYYG